MHTVHMSFIFKMKLGSFSLWIMLIVFQPLVPALHVVSVVLDKEIKKYFGNISILGDFCVHIPDLVSFSYPFGYGIWCLIFGVVMHWKSLCKWFSLNIYLICFRLHIHSLLGTLDQTKPKKEKKLFLINWIILICMRDNLGCCDWLCYALLSTVLNSFTALQFWLLSFFPCYAVK